MEFGWPFSPLFYYTPLNLLLAEKCPQGNTASMFSFFFSWLALMMMMMMMMNSAA